MAAPDTENTEKAMKMAQQEMDYRVDLYNRFKDRLHIKLFQPNSSAQLTDTTAVHLRLQNGSFLLRQMHGQEVR